MRTKLSRVALQFLLFARLQNFGAILLLTSTVAALLWANSPWRAAYALLWGTSVTVGVGPTIVSTTLSHIVNDGLMAIFFFVVGLEIKRELVVGELSERRKAMLPIVAAVGGMIFPALFFSLLNSDGSGARGWGIPMATDIAFAIGVLALLGPGIPLGLKIFLTAFAIVDDLGAILVIALFYTEAVSWQMLGIGIALLILLVLLNANDIQRPLPYLVTGALLWIAFLMSGVHATVAGVLLAMTIPADSRNSLKSDSVHRGSLLHHMEYALHPWVSFVIMPLFALSNAGLVLDGSLSFSDPVAVGIVLGLVVGKPIGIVLFSWLAVRIRVATLPSGTGWRHMVGAGVLGGIGFTMSLFIAALAFPGNEELIQAKMGVLVSSVIAGVLGWAYLRSIPTTYHSQR